MRLTRFNGTLLAPDDAERIRVGVAAKPGLIETMRAHRGRIAVRELHLERLRASIAELGWTRTARVSDVADELDVTLAAIDATDSAVRMVVFEHGAVLSETWSIDRLPDRPRAVGAVTCRGLWDPRAAAAEHKLTDRGHWVGAESAATDAGVDVAIAVDTDGRLGEASRASVFVVLDGVVTTAPVQGILPGVGRRIVCAEHGEVVFAAVSEHRWRAADEMFIVSALRGVTAVVAVDDRPIGSGSPGPVTHRIADAVRARVGDLRAV
jgi:branched-subunit amino acid aminotransferase/4-amino-4-deoxychorismate lyase